jgi:hypothetical protein
MAQNVAVTTDWEDLLQWPRRLGRRQRSRDGGRGGRSGCGHAEEDRGAEDGA